MANKLNDKNFKYYKELFEKDKEEHQSKLSLYNRPDDVIAAYNGRFDSTETDGKGKDSDMMLENYLFISANTVLPSLFFQKPRIHVRAKRDELQFEASVLSAWANADFSDQDKKENQLCIIDAFLPYGFATMKVGYNSRVGKVSNASSVFTGKQSGANEKDMEEDLEYLEYERTVRLRQSPKTTYLDHTQPFGKGNRISYVYDRTLQQLIDSNLYNLSSNFISHYGAKNKDKRLVDLELVEMWCNINGDIYKLAWIKGWNEPIAWVKTEYDEIPVSYLRFNQMGDMLYNISHGTLGLKAQKELNYLNELWKKHVDNIRNQHLVNEQSLTESGKLTLRTNEIGGTVFTNGPVTSGTAAPLQSAQMDANLFANINNVRDYLKLLLSTTGGKGGGPDSDLATVEKNKAIGDALRSSGMQDAIRDFIVDQVKKSIKNVMKMGSPNITLKLTGESLTFPTTGQPVQEGDELMIGGETGFDLKELITGDIDIDFLIDVDITSATRPDFPVIRKQLVEGITMAAQLDPLMKQMGKRINYDKMLEDFFGTFDAIPDAQKYISTLSEEEKQAMMMAQMGQITQQGGGVPQEQSIAMGAEQAPPETGGMGNV